MMYDIPSLSLSAVSEHILIWHIRLPFFHTVAAPLPHSVPYMGTERVNGLDTHLFMGLASN
jgi:hypothetical protein